MCVSNSLDSHFRLPKPGVQIEASKNWLRLVVVVVVAVVVVAGVGVVVVIWCALARLALELAAQTT